MTAHNLSSMDDQSEESQSEKLCAVIEGVNELKDTRKVPSSAEEGWPRHKEKVRSHLVGADGVVLVKRI